MSNLSAMPVANIVAAEIITLENDRRVYHFSTAKSVTPEPFVSEGAEEELRCGNRILAQNLLEDIVKGYDIKLKDVVFSPELLALVEGGSVECDANGGFAAYHAPVAGAISSRTRFALVLYAEEKDYDGSAVSYFRFTYPSCIGTTAEFGFEDGAFFAPEYTIKSRPPFGRKSVVIEQLDFLPEYLASEEDIPSQPVLGQEYIAEAALAVDGIVLAAGDSVVYTENGYEKIERDI